MVVGSSVLASEDGREGGGPCTLLEDYAGKSLLLTGATGFLGTALVEKILWCLQGLKQLYVLIRPSKRRAASARFCKELLASPAFRRMRRLLGDGFEEFVAQKVCVLEGDLAEEDLGLKTEELFELSREVDVLIHCAAEASFDAPLDVALDSNVLGTLRLLRLAKEWEKRPLFLYVSTAYVCGMDQEMEEKKGGAILEEVPSEVAPNGMALDAQKEVWRLGREIEGIRRSSATTEGAKDKLVVRGRERAQELGWYDVYTFTKSLAERMVLREHEELPLVIVRPAICVSSLREPYQGWMKGFRMADPLFMAYGKGLLPECPADPEGLIDLVPVDHVVNAILACGALRPARPEVFHLAYSGQSPIRIKELYALLREYFLEHPLVDPLTKKPIRVSALSFGGERALWRRLWLARLALGTLKHLTNPLPSRIAAFKALKRRISRAHSGLERVLYYNVLYGPYLKDFSSRAFSSVRSRLLYKCLSEEDQEAFPFALEGIDWRGWLHETHLPALTGRRRSKDERGETSTRTAGRSAAHAS